MTLEEAIKHCEEQAVILRQTATQIARAKSGFFKYEQCRECAREHDQLAEWLKELKAYREAVEPEQEKLVIIRAKIKLDNVALQFYRDKFKKEFEEGLIFLPECFEATVHNVIHDVKIEGGQT